MKLAILATVLLVAPVFTFAQDLEGVFQSLKDAEAKNDAALVKKLGAETCALARKMKEEPAPAAADDKEGWLSRIAYAKSVESFTEYALFSVAAKSEPASSAPKTR